ncbi:hypothetical protein [Leptospira noguchii]|uniref:hypothetical protein n=1 Tax=Leptospira noguchii TaxID=28182 RepID=UPI0018DED7D3|nr:hypothetical protein [Leptospira noguchii]
MNRRSQEGRWQIDRSLNSAKCFLRKRLKLSTTLSYGSAFTESLHLSLLFAPIFLRRTHVR